MTPAHSIKNQLLCCLLLLTLMLPAACAENTPRPFGDRAEIDQFISEMVRDHQFNSEQLQSLFDKVRLNPVILETIARPAESKPWREYRPIFLTRERIRGGVFFMNEHATILARASDTYGVPPQVITAIIGVETRYGKNSGNFPVIDALSTLGFAYPPRKTFFRAELKQFLLMSREEKFDPLEPRGSYAGAMGMPQFIPSSFRRYAVDFDNDGKRDLWSSTADAIGSVGNYFEKHGWQSWEPIATRVTIKGDKYQNVMDGNGYPRFAVADLEAAGVIFPDEVEPHLKGSLIMLDAGEGPEFWVVWRNFYVITRYNHSILYAMAALQLSREIVAAR